MVTFQINVKFHVNMFQAQNKNFTLVGHVVYCVSVISSKLIEINVCVFNPELCMVECIF